jgi:hypothetical protein
MTNLAEAHRAIATLVTPISNGVADREKKS